MSPIHFEAKISTIGSTNLIRLPLNVSTQLPSRGMTLVEGTINGVPFKIPLEPDGKKSHWFNVDQSMLTAIKVQPGDTVTAEITPSKDWPEPPIPADIQTALNGDSAVQTLWEAVTPAARWDWIRWIRATNNPATRAKRIQVSFSKLRSGMKRPCCFNQSMCTDFTVSKNGILLDTTDQ